MEIVVRTDSGEAVLRPESGASGTAAPGPAGGGLSAGAAPPGPGQSGAPAANVAATEPPRATSSADQSAGAAPELS